MIEFTTNDFGQVYNLQFFRLVEKSKFIHFLFNFDFHPLFNGLRRRLYQIFLIRKTEMKRHSHINLSKAVNYIEMHSMKFVDFFLEEKNLRQREYRVFNVLLRN